MRKIICIIICLLYCKLAFSQIKHNENNTFSTKSLHNINFTENISNVNNHLENLFSEIIKIEIKDIQKNSEGKFGEETKVKKIFNTRENKRKENLNSSLLLKAKEEFIFEVIDKKLDEEIEKYIQNHEALTYGDRNLEFYKNYDELKNKLIIRKKIFKQIELQIGKDIYPYLTKILKTELDKTLQNSLNLMAVNF